MSAVISLSEQRRVRQSGRAASDADLARANGGVELGFAVSDGTTRLQALAQRSPCRVLLPRELSPEPTATLINTAGGLCGGDRLRTEVTVGAGAEATVTGQAAERIYRALDHASLIESRLHVADGGRLHWAPQETILFDAARLDRRMVIELAGTGRLLAGESLVFGRSAMGEVLRRLSLRERWQIVIDGRLAWSDALRLDGVEALAAPGGLNGAGALATVVARGEDPEGCRERVRELLAAAAMPGFETGASLVNGLLLVRLLGPPLAVRRTQVALFNLLRPAVLGFAADLPRAWSC